MKRAALIPLLLLLASCHKDRGQNSWAAMHLRGKAKSLEVVEYKLSKKPVPTGEDSVLNKAAFQFNNRGYIATEYVWLSNGHFKRCTYKFDDVGKPTEALKYNDDSTFCYKALFTYREDGLLAGQKQYDIHDSLNLRIVYLYDEKGNKVAESSYWENGKLLNKYTYVYNGQGLEASRNFYNADSALVMRATYAYNDSGYKKEEHKYGDEDEKGWLTTYSYDAYDKQGNWVSRTTMVDGKPASITKRVITYY
jgi:hypothetical protein